MNANKVLLNLMISQCSNFRWLSRMMFETSSAASNWGQSRPTGSVFPQVELILDKHGNVEIIFLFYLR